jgi:acetamidase/formamidase
MRRFPRDATTLFFDPRAEPLAEVADGERVVVETADSLCGLAKARLAGRQAAAGMHIDEVLERLGGACPVTGPLHLAGARPGDVVEVELHRAIPPRPPARPGPGPSVASGPCARGLHAAAAAGGRAAPGPVPRRGGRPAGRRR